MMPTLVPIAHQFTVGMGMFTRAVGDFSPADWLVRDAAGHDARWIAGHLTHTRCQLLTLLGAPLDGIDWLKKFQRGALPADVPEDIDGARIAGQFAETHRPLLKALDTVDEERLGRALGRTLPDGSSTHGGAVVFLAWHEAYHLGQLGLLRRLAGRSAVV